MDFGDCFYDWEWEGGEKEETMKKMNQSAKVNIIDNVSNLLKILIVDGF